MAILPKILEKKTLTDYAKNPTDLTFQENPDFMFGKCR